MDYFYDPASGSLMRNLAPLIMRQANYHGIAAQFSRLTLIVPSPQLHSGEHAGPWKTLEAHNAGNKDVLANSI